MLRKYTDIDEYTYNTYMCDAHAYGYKQGFCALRIEKYACASGMLSGGQGLRHAPARHRQHQGLPHRRGAQRRHSELQLALWQREPPGERTPVDPQGSLLCQNSQVDAANSKSATNVAHGQSQLFR